MSLRPWSFRVALLSCAALAGLLRPEHAAAAPAPLQQRQRVEVVFCVDTTGSMSLIEPTKKKIWLICNQILDGTPTPELKVGIVNFKDRGDAFITKVYDLTDDLDHVYSEFFTFRAEGGGDTPESVNQALDDAVNKIQWGKDKRTLKLIFLIGDAPPHMDYPDDVKYPVSCKKAVEKGIVINAIQAGTDADCAKYWRDISGKANGLYAQIPSAGGMADYSTPHDRRLAELNAELVRTTLVWGSAAKRDADAKKLRQAGSLTGQVAADRVGALAKMGMTAAYDLLDNICSGKVKLGSLKTEDLPAEMRKMSDKERREFLDKTSRRRRELFKEVMELDRKRAPELLKEGVRHKDSLDSNILEMLRKQAKKSRIRY
jgi:hypothetical protein